MPFVVVEMLKGRTVDQKRAAARAITNAIVETLNTKPESVHVIFHEIERHDIASAGTLLSDR